MDRRWLAQLGVCVFACAIGMPLGVLIVNTLGGPEIAAAQLTAGAYVALGLTAITIYAVIVSIPARLLATRPVTGQLAYE